MQLNEMMHVDIKIGIDMQSCRSQMRAGPAGPMLRLFTNFCSLINNDPKTNYYSRVTIMFAYNRHSCFVYFTIYCVGSVCTLSMPYISIYRFPIPVAKTCFN